MANGYVTTRRGSSGPGSGTTRYQAPNWISSGYDRAGTVLRGVRNTSSNSGGAPINRQITTSFRTSYDVPGDISPAEYRTLLLSGNDYKGQSFDTGHTFDTSRETWTYSHLTMGDWLWNTPRGVHGIFGPYWALPGTLPDEPSFDTQFYGSRAIKKASPTAPQAELATTLAEIIRERGFASLPGSQFSNALMRGTDRARSAGSEYLNLAFGWIPLLSDLHNVLKAVVNSAAIIKQMERDSGRVVRRRMRFPTQTNSESIATPSGSNYRDLYSPGTTGMRQASDLAPEYREVYWNSSKSSAMLRPSYTTYTRQDIWFSGAFTYYLDPGKTLIGKFERYEQLANKLLGIRITPGVLWELTPWSWLSDWFVDLGTGLQTASMFQKDDLVLKYGYLMRKTTRGAVTSITFKNYVGEERTFTTEHKLVRKERFRATPYGFGLNPQSFTERQWAILGALGLSKAPRSLW